MSELDVMTEGDRLTYDLYDPHLDTDVAVELSQRVSDFVRTEEIAQQTHDWDVEEAAERMRVSRDAKRKVLVEQGAFGLFNPAEVVTVEELRLRPELPDLVNGVLGAGELSMLFGESYSGKSFLAMDWALSIATGENWHGHSVQKGRVLYLAMEGVATIKKREAAWRAAHGGIETDDFDIYPHVVSLMDDTAVSMLRDYVKAGRYSLVVVDTLSRSFGGGNESDTEAMGTYVAALSKLREASDELTVVVIHHAKKDAPEEYRGSTVLFAALDRVVCLKMGKPDDPSRKMIYQKVKSGELPPAVGLRFEQSGPSAVLVPYAVDAQEPVEVTVWRELNARLGEVPRKLLEDTLLTQGHVATDGTARNRVGKLVTSGVFDLLPGKLLQLADMETVPI